MRSLSMNEIIEAVRATRAVHKPWLAYLPAWNWHASNHDYMFKMRGQGKGAIYMRIRDFPKWMIE
jgi:hypothetical protein